MIIATSLHSKTLHTCIDYADFTFWATETRHGKSMKSKDCGRFWMGFRRTSSRFTRLRGTGLTTSLCRATLRAVLGEVNAPSVQGASIGTSQIYPGRQGRMILGLPRFTYVYPRIQPCSVENIWVILNASKPFLLASKMLKANKQKHNKRISLGMGPKDHAMTVPI